MDEINQFVGPHRFLSNFWHVRIWFEGDTYPTVEHAYQAAKTTDPGERKLIRAALTPGKAKRAGRYAITLRKDWTDEFKLALMTDLLRQKFRNDPLRSWLLETGDAKLVEGNHHHDRYWGVEIGTGIGKNHLGRLLMKVRDGLRHRSQKEETGSGE